MEARTCVQCGSPLPDHARFCGQCGAVTPPGMSRFPRQPAPGLGPGPVAAPAPAAKTVLEAPDLETTSMDPITVADPVPPAETTSTPVMVPPRPTGLRDYARTVIDPPRPAAAVTTPAPAPAPQRQPIGRTVVGFSSPDEAEPGHLAPAVAASVGMKGTMIGFAADAVPQPPAAQPASLTPAMPIPSAKGTMIGIAASSLGPLAPGAAPPPAQGAPQRSNVNQTMLGVARPGIAPTHAGEELGTSHAWSEPGIHHGTASAGEGPALRRAVEIAPMPPPLTDDEPLPAAPLIVNKRGVPLGLLGGLLGAVVLIAGVTVALVWKSPPLVAQPQIDAHGHDQLHLTCAGCPDGTIAEMEGQKATFTSQIADLNLTVPLRVGDNKLVIHLDRPSLGRDEAVSLAVPLTYRVRTDLAEIGAPHPAIVVRVDAVPGTDVLLDGKPVALDASGSGSYAIDISGETEGTAEEVRIIDRNIGYVVTPKGATPQKGTVEAKVGITPLRLEAPGSHPVIDTPTFHIAGRTSKASVATPGQPPQPATVTVNGRPLTVGADGVFAEPVDAPAAADLPIELRATAPQLAPRTAHFTVRRVDHLADEARAREALPGLGYDALAADVAANVGQAVIVEGDVVDARVANQQTLAVVDDARGCAKGPCLIRIVTGGETPMKRGDAVRAYGRLTRTVSTANGPVPEMEADFVVKGRSSPRVAPPPHGAPRLTEPRSNPGYL